ncbi:coniferyl-alcohol dehydrogenase [Rhodococcus aetherivorans]|uniref:coniferyl-alcohol dehydrogenase n=1 Tax=Rhodococcus aetherivorans TaxID=191292 RepID=UPI0002D242D5|nr:coniferyl-alcohol dehydrogenase [Rhodococcus aetherivorans]CCW14895.1 3-alpha-hydroxysteroid dehydrogenase [Rhodococcus aetherivorans]
MTDLHGKRFIVTGAASGIGHAVAEGLLAAGAEVTSLDRNDPSAAVKQHISVDLSDPSSIDQAVDQLDGHYDGLLNVAGIPGTAPSEKVLAVNFLGLRHLTESLFDRLNEGGAIVNVSSTAGFNWAARLDSIKELLATDNFEEGAKWFAEHPQEGNAYNFSKEVTTVYTMTMGCAVLEFGLRMNAVLPGPVETPILVDFETSMGKDNLDGIKEMLGRHARPEDIASAVLFLASPESAWINGHPLVVDGGITGAVVTGLVPAPEI